MKAHGVFGAFGLVIVVNGQDVAYSCTVCGPIGTSTLDRIEEPAVYLTRHISSHVRAISVIGEAAVIVRRI